MGFFKRLSSLFSAPAQDTGNAYWVAVKCSRCGEIVRARVDLRNDLSLDYDSGETVYFCRKSLMGSQRCYAQMEVELRFDANRKLIDRQVQGGQFVEDEAGTESPQS